MLRLIACDRQPAWVRCCRLWTPWRAGAHALVGSQQAFSTAVEEPAGSITFRADTPGATNLEDLFSRLAKGQEVSPQPPPPPSSPRVLSDEARAACRPRNEALDRSKQLNRLQFWTPKNIERVVGSFGKVHHYHRLWHRLAGLMVEHPLLLNRMTPEQVAKLAWGYAQVKVQEPQLLNLIAEHVRRRITVFTPHQLAELAWAFAELQHTGSRGFLSLTVQQVEARWSELEPRVLVKLLKALSDSRELTVSLLERFLPIIADHVHELKTPALLQVLCVVADVYNQQHKSQLPPKDASATMPVMKLLQVTAPELVTRAQQTCAEWEQGIGTAAPLRDLLWLQRQWQDWASVLHLYRRLAEAQDLEAVEAAIDKLEQLRMRRLPPQQKGRYTGQELQMLR